MRNLRSRYTPEQRAEFQDTVNDLEHYIRPLLLQRQQGVCAMCKQPHSKYDIDHKIYNPILTLNELQLLCVPCHKSITDYTTFKNRRAPSSRKYPRYSVGFVRR